MTNRYYYDPVELSASMRNSVEYMKRLAKRKNVVLDDQQAVTLALWFTRLVESGKPERVAFNDALIIAQSDPADIDDIENDVLGGMVS